MHCTCVLSYLSEPLSVPPLIYDIHGMFGLSWKVIIKYISNKI